MHTPDHLEKLERFKAYNPTAAQLLEAAQHEVDDADLLTRRQHMLSWLGCLIAAGIMFETLFFKFTGAAESVYIFKRMGTEPWMRWVQGVWELTHRATNSRISSDQGRNASKGSTAAKWTFATARYSSGCSNA